jgi:hypothetical protein
MDLMPTEAAEEIDLLHLLPSRPSLWIVLVYVRARYDGSVGRLAM